ncbi:MAG: exodeoxyribonuclease V subunit gamma [Fibrobacter sp.]|nr:exodeoxyribonuclease V subunit gamma [Fibrobacter sp.]
MAFNLYTSNRIESLLPTLADIIRQPRKSIFQEEVIVVQSRGMEQWLSLEIAKLLKINAFCKFPFPTAFFNNLLQVDHTFKGDLIPFDPGLLTWRIFNLLPSMLDDPLFTQLKSYLVDNNDIKRFQLSKKIADIFDQYTMYRTDMIEQWEKNTGDHSWQMRLWQKLSIDIPAHRLHLKNKFINTLKVSKGHPDLPERVSFFGISSLPVFFTDMIEILAQFIDINYFLLNPCSEFWDDIISERELTQLNRKRKRLRKKAVDITTEHYETLNPLLSSFGTYGRDFLARLHGGNSDESYTLVTSESQSLLQQIQNQVVMPTEAISGIISPSDTSIQIHSCHSKLREIQVLHDFLLDSLNANPELKLSDIAVMAPEIGEYSVHVSNVFNASNGPQMQYTITDKTLQDSSPVSATFLEILALVNSRFTFTSIINILENEAVREKFNLSIDEILQIKNWLIETQINWARDPKHKESLNLPPTSENTWKSGIDQLMLGFVMPKLDFILYQGITGNDLISSSTSAETFGKFLTFYKAIENITVTLSKSYTLIEWVRIINSLISTFFNDNETTQSELSTLTRTTERLISYTQHIESTSQDADNKLVISFDVILTWLKGEVASIRISHGYMNGGITFCSLLPMRGIPFKVICLIGMNENVFPRRGNVMSWDLIANRPRKGDRSIEIEDRYVFLETIMSAREKFYISYLGQNEHNERVAHASICVEELVGYVRRMVRGKNSEARIQKPVVGSEEEEVDRIQNPVARSQEEEFSSQNPEASIQEVEIGLVRRHKLHAFNAAYFRDLRYSPKPRSLNTHPLSPPAGDLGGVVSGGKDTTPFSYNTRSYQSAVTLLNSKGNYDVKPFIIHDIPLPDDHKFEITINDLIKFYKNPSKYFLNNVLRMEFAYLQEAVDDVESFRLDNLESYDIRQQIFDAVYNSRGSEKELYNYYKVLNLLPHGQPGLIEFDTIFSDVQTFSRRVAEYTTTAQLENPDIDYTFENIFVYGTLRPVFKSNLIVCRNSKEKPLDLIGAWIQHLFLNALKSDDYPKSTILLSSTTSRLFKPVNDPKQYLDIFLKFFKNGNIRPLRFFPWTSAKYVEQLSSGREKALLDATKMWLEGTYNSSNAESEDRYISLCFDGEARPLIPRPLNTRALNPPQGDFENEGQSSSVVSSSPPAGDLWGEVLGGEVSGAAISGGVYNTLNTEFEAIASQILLPLYDHMTDVSGGDND